MTGGAAMSIVEITLIAFITLILGFAASSLLFLRRLRRR